jgi:single-stranded DNA-binding protein
VSLNTAAVASDRRNRDAGPVYVDLILWEGQAEAAAQHLVKGQAVTFSGRFEPREYTTRSGRSGVALELHSVELEYGPRPRGAEQDAPSAEPPPAPAAVTDEDIPF